MISFVKMTEKGYWDFERITGKLRKGKLKKFRGHLYFICIFFLLLFMMFMQEEKIKVKRD